jgi:hypothetical protein
MMPDALREAAPIGIPIISRPIGRWSLSRQADDGPIWGDWAVLDAGMGPRMARERSV